MSTDSSLRQQIIGAWELVSYVVHSEKSAGKVHYPLGEDARGIIMYNESGYMSAQLQRTGQKAFNATWPADGTESELAESARNYVGYSGPFYLDESGPTPVVHHGFTLSSFPNWLGDTQKRVARLDGDVLTITLEAPLEIKGELWNPILEWRRVVNNQTTPPSIKQ